MDERIIPEKCCIEDCDKKAEYFHKLELPEGNGEYEKVGEKGLDGVSDEEFDVVKWTGKKKEHVIGYCEEHA